MNTKEELKKLLKRINSAEDVEEIKPEIKKKLRGINPTDLSRAEQELAKEEDIGADEIRDLCGPHLEILEEKNLQESQEETQKREEGHPRSVLEGEHDVLLDKLDELSEIIDELDTLNSFEELEDYIDQLKDISRHLLDAESHHNREEEALFPEVEKKGLTGPTEVMREEHEDYLEKKKALGELIENRDELGFDRFAQKLKRIGSYLVEGMRDHIYKENNILYPAAGDVLSEEEWRKVKRKSDDMGYTFFSPVQESTAKGNLNSENDPNYEVGEEIDLRNTPAPQRHPKFFEKFDSLKPGKKLVLINDHDPRPLYYEMKEERAGTFAPESYQVFERGDKKFEAHFPKKREKGSSQPGKTGKTVDLDEIWEKLEKVEDPEFGTSVVKMDLIDEVSIEDGTVSVDFHLTAPVCPPPFVLNMAKQIKKYVSELEKVSKVDVTVKEHNRAEEINEEIKRLEENNGEFN